MNLLQLMVGSQWDVQPARLPPLDYSPIAASILVAAEVDMTSITSMLKVVLEDTKTIKIIAVLETASRLRAELPSPPIPLSILDGHAAPRICLSAVLYAPFLPRLSETT